MLSCSRSAPAPSVRVPGDSNEGHRGVATLLLLPTRSLLVCAAGLNLASANHVIFAAPCLDAAVRKQAVGRCHRMGQLRPVRVTTLAVRGTVEEAALALMHRDDLPSRVGANGNEVTDQYTLRLAALEERALP